MTALVVLALAWILLALSMAIVMGHCIRIADACAPSRNGEDDARGSVHQLPAVSTA